MTYYIIAANSRSQFIEITSVPLTDTAKYSIHPPTLIIHNLH